MQFFDRLHREVMTMKEKFADFNSYQYEINLNSQTPSWLKQDARKKRPTKRESDQPRIFAGTTQTSEQGIECQDYRVY